MVGVLLTVRVVMGTWYSRFLRRGGSMLSTMAIGRIVHPGFAAAMLVA